MQAPSLLAWALRLRLYVGAGAHIDAGETPAEPSGFTIDEMTRGRLGTLSPSERK